VQNFHVTQKQSPTLLTLGTVRHASFTAIIICMLTLLSELPDNELSIIITACHQLPIS
jgi:hypothetical protein